jgi:hypothetical protein
MKKILIIPLILISYLGYSQSIKLDSLTHEFKYDTVYSTSFEKVQIYSKLKSWSSSYFADSKSVIEQDDKDFGQYFFKSSFTVNYILNGQSSNQTARVIFKCRIYIKDKKVKVIITSISIDGFIYNSMLAGNLKLRPDNFLHQAIKQSDIRFKSMLASIDKTINSKSEGDF